MLFFHFAKIENHSVIFQLYFSLKNLKRKWIPYLSLRAISFCNFRSSQSLGDSCRSPTKQSKVARCTGNNKKSNDATQFAKTVHKIQLKPNLDNKKSDLRFMNLPFTSAVKNRIQRNKSWARRRHVMLFLFRPTTKKAKNFRVLRLILNRYQNFQRDPGLLGPQYFFWTAV